MPPWSQVLKVKLIGLATVLYAGGKVREDIRMIPGFLTGEIGRMVAPLTE